MSNLDIPLTRPSFSGHEYNALEDVLKAGWDSQGPKVVEFEEAIVKKLGSRYAVATSSCTAGLYMTLGALGIRKGDKVAVSAFTWPSTAFAISLLGGIPIFVDVNEDTYNMNPIVLEEILGDHDISAIMPVHLFGNPCEMKRIKELAQEGGKIPIVEDAACAIGSMQQGSYIGENGTAIFSFHGRKVLTCGEGGMITTNKERLANCLRLERDMGVLPGGTRYQKKLFLKPANNFKLSDIQGAIGTAQVSRLEEILSARALVAGEYHSRLANMAGVTLPSIRPGDLHSWQAYVVTLEDGIDRDAVIFELAKKGIETTFGTYSVPDTDAYGLEVSDCPIASILENTTLALPIYPTMLKRDIQRVVNGLGEAIGV